MFSNISRSSKLLVTKYPQQIPFLYLQTQSFSIFSRKDKQPKKPMAPIEKFNVSKSDLEWRAQLSPEQFRVLREKGTERPGTGEYNHAFNNGVYNCAACEAPLYTSKTKFDSGCGWPAFYEAIPNSIKLYEDRSMGTLRTEMVCANCGGHLGHVFKGEGFKTPTDERHCVNSVSLTFVPEK